MLLLRVLGQFLLWIGFLAAAVATVLRTEVDGNKWATIPWVYYGMAMAVGIAGAVLLRTTARSLESCQDRVESDFTVLQGSLTTLIANVGELRNICRQGRPLAIVNFIDEQCVIPFADFADARNALKQRYGLQAFADVMTQFASGERFVNRAWSASADGYLQEASDSLETAERHLNNAEMILNGLIG